MVDNGPLALGSVYDKMHQNGYIPFFLSHGGENGGCVLVSSPEHSEEKKISSPLTWLKDYLALLAGALGVRFDHFNCCGTLQHHQNSCK